VPLCTSKIVQRKARYNGANAAGSLWPKGHQEIKTYS